MKRSAVQRAVECFRGNKGVLRTSGALRFGIHPETLYRMRNEGIIEQLSRGVYRLADLPPLDNVDLVTVALTIPHGVICLISALTFHGLTTQIPHQIDIACKRGTKQPVLQDPPVRLFWCSMTSFECGIEQHELDGVKVQIYSPEKAIVDCFKYRNRVGLDVAIEALKTYWNERRGSVDRLMECAVACRMTKIIRPYIESVIHE